MLRQNLSYLYQQQLENIQTFFAFSKNVNFFSKLLFFSFAKNSLSMSIHFCHLCGSFSIPFANHDVDLLLKYRFTAEMKATLVSYLFPASSFFQFWKQIKVTGGKVWDNNCHLKELISSTVDEAVREGTLSCKRRTFIWASLRHNFFSFSLSFFSKSLLNCI